MSKFLPFVLLSLLLAAPAFAQSADDAEAQVKAVCAHLNTHALDYSDEDKGECIEQLNEVFADIPVAERQVFVGCVTQHTPITQDQFGECIMAHLDGADGGDDDDDVFRAQPKVTPEIQALCTHLEKNAVEFTDEDKETCGMMMAMLAEMGGDEAKFTSFSKCVLALTKPADKELEACLKSSGLSPAE